MANIRGFGGESVTQDGPQRSFMRFLFTKRLSSDPNRRIPDAGSTPHP